MPPITLFPYLALLLLGLCSCGQRSIYDHIEVTDGLYVQKDAPCAELLRLRKSATFPPEWSQFENKWILKLIYFQSKVIGQEIDDDMGCVYVQLPKRLNIKGSSIHGIPFFKQPDGSWSLTATPLGWLDAVNDPIESNMDVLKLGEGKVLAILEEKR